MMVDHTHIQDFYTVKGFHSREQSIVIGECYVSQSDDRAQRPHRHQYEELTLILSGSATHVTEHGSYHIQQGDCFLIHVGDVHHYQDIDQLERQVLCFRSEMLAPVMADLMDLPGYHALFQLPMIQDADSKPGLLHLNKRELKRARRFLDELLEEQSHRKPGWKGQMSATFMGLMIFLCRQYELSGSPLVQSLSLSLAYMNEHFSEKITLEELAEIAGYSESHFRVLFRDALGKAPMDYLMELRINRACQLLRQSEYNITEIAFLTGFNDSNYFCRQFKKHLKTTPMRYRQSL